jgi:hypothetical protein
VVTVLEYGGRFCVCAFSRNPVCHRDDVSTFNLTCTILQCTKNYCTKVVYISNMYYRASLHDLILLCDASVDPTLQIRSSSILALPTVGIP